MLTKISENLNILHKPFALQTCAARCFFLYLSTDSVPSGVFVIACVSEFWLFSLHHFHVCLRISKWWVLRSKELALNFASNSTKLQLRPTEARAFEWFKRFKDGWESVEDDKHSGRLSTRTTPEMIAKVREVIVEDRRQTTHNVCNSVGLSYGPCQRILAEELIMRRIAAKFVPCLLNSDQRDHRIRVCTELQEAVRHDPYFLSRVITGDESWVYCCDPETKQESSQWKTPSSPRPKKVRKFRSNIKSMLIIFLGIQGIVHKEFVPSGQTVNGEFYCEVLRRLRENVWSKQPEMWKNRNWLLHHDNAPAHTSLVLREFLTKKEHDHCSPPCLLTRPGPLRFLHVP